MRPPAHTPSPSLYSSSSTASPPGTEEKLPSLVDCCFYLDPSTSVDHLRSVEKRSRALCIPKWDLLYPLSSSWMVGRCQRVHDEATMESCDTSSSQKGRVFAVRRRASWRPFLLQADIEEKLPGLVDCCFLPLCCFFCGQPLGSASGTYALSSSLATYILWALKSWLAVQREQDRQAAIDLRDNTVP